MSISHGHRPYSYSKFIPEMEAKDLIKAVDTKQNLYDQGYEAIQKKLNDLSALPLLKDVDKDYANQELKKIYKTIQTNAANADFSNPNTLKNFLDVSRPLEQDPIIDSAIRSSGEYMTRLKTLQDVREKGKGYSDVNAWMYMKDAEEWLNDPNPGSKLNPAQYIPYRDISENWSKEKIASMTPDIQSSIIKEKGMLGVKELETLTKDRIFRKILSEMDESDYKQLQMDALYKANNIPYEEKFIEVVKPLAMIKKLYEPDTLEYKAAVEQLSKLEQGDENLLNNLYVNSYMNGKIGNVADTYAYEQTKLKVSADAYALAEQKFRQQKELIKYENSDEIIDQKIKLEKEKNKSKSENKTTKMSDQEKKDYKANEVYKIIRGLGYSPTGKLVTTLIDEIKLGVIPGSEQSSIEIIEDEGVIKYQTKGDKNKVFIPFTKEQSRNISDLLNSIDFNTTSSEEEVIKTESTTNKFKSFMEEMEDNDSTKIDISDFIN